MLYNLKIIEYIDSIHVRVYSRPISSGVELNKFLSDEKHSFLPYERKRTTERTQEMIEHSEHVSIGRTVNQIYAIVRSNVWEYFVTLTIDPKKLDNTDYIMIVQKLNYWANNLKKRYAPDLKYVFVPELHKDKRKWHFHGLFANVGNIPFVFSGKTCVGKFVYDYAKKPFATKIYNLPLWKYGFSTATRVRDSKKASSYITKYLTKDLVRVLPNQNRYFASLNCDRPVEKVFYIEPENLKELIEKHYASINYMSNIELKDATQKIYYMEFNKGESKNDR